jgi:guanylate kinase
MQQHNPQIKKKMKQFYFIFISCKMTQQRKNADKNKTERMKIKLWPKAQIAKESEQR